MTDATPETPTDDLAGLIADLVRIPTENPPGGERPCAEFVIDWFEGEGIDAELVETPGSDRPNAVAVIGEVDGPGPTLVLNGHTDVVPAGDPDRWRHDPFGAEVEGDRLYGRGAADMKTGLAVAMLTARDLAAEIASGDLRGAIVVHAAMGEETGDPGTRTLVDEGYGGDRAVVLEPTDFRVGTSGKGVATFRIGVEGESCHASRPDQGVNAIDLVRPVLDAIGEYDRRVREREDALVGRAYATVTELEAGTDSNFAVVPERAELLLDRRVLPGESYDDVEAEIRTMLEGVGDEGGLDADLELVQYYAPAAIPVDSPLAETVRGHAADLAGAPTEPWGLEAATDAREFVADGIPAIIWGPGNLKQAHTVDEHVDLADAETGLAILKQAVRELLSP